MTLPTLAVRIGKGLYELSRDGKVVKKKKANVARLKIYTNLKRAGEDETSGPTDEGTNSDGSGESKPRRLKPDPKRGGAPEPKTLPPPKSFV